MGFIMIISIRVYNVLFIISTPFYIPPTDLFLFPTSSPSIFMCWFLLTNEFH